MNYVAGHVLVKVCWLIASSQEIIIMLKLSYEVVLENVIKNTFLFTDY